MKLPRVVRQFAQILQDSGYSCYVVGGAVRNLIAGLKASDYDFATDALPEDIRRIFQKVIPTGIEHGTVTVLFQDQSFEITTYRTEGRYTDRRHPDHVTFTPSLYEDLKRRDFTINAIAVDPLSKEVVDPHHGICDINQATIRAIGNPRERFAEDGLRLLRACRFCACLNFEIEKGTFEGMIESAHHISKVSAERIREELEKLLSAERPSVGFYVLENTGILRLILPELCVGRGVQQGGGHEFDVLDHLFFTCDGAPKEDKITRLAALLHDVGKPATREKDTRGFLKFHRHEHISAQVAARILRRLKFPKDIENRVTHLIQNHMYNYDSTWSDAAVRRFIARIGRESIPQLFKLRQADCYALQRRHFLDGKISQFQRHIDYVLEQDNALSIHDLCINGNELNLEVGIPKSPVMGQTLNFLLEVVMDDPSLNRHDKLIEIAKRFYDAYHAD